MIKKIIFQGTRFSHLCSSCGLPVVELEQQVLATTSHKNRRVNQIEVVAETGERETIDTTGGHPFWVAGLGWVPAAELQADDLLYSPRGGWLKVSSGTWLTDVYQVYNFEVEHDHTYFVGESKVWVHNQSNDSRAPIGNGEGAPRGGIDQTAGQQIARGHGRDHRHDFPDIDNLDDFGDMVDGMALIIKWAILTTLTYTQSTSTPITAVISVHYAT